MGKILKEIWQVEGVDIPVKIYLERRANNRISITKNGVNLRVPSFGAGLMRHSFESWARNWIAAQLEARPDIAARFKSDHLVSGHVIHTPVREYILRIKKESRATSVARLRNNEIHLTLNDQLSGIEEVKAKRTLIARIIGKDQFDRVDRRIRQINKECFGQEIQQVRIKNNSSNWGSCSNTGNINISTKTLLAPIEIQDYIFVHELAHRIEMNHSDRYWNIVRKVMPDYEKCERWIKENGHLCEI